MKHPAPPRWSEREKRLRGRAGMAQRQRRMAAAGFACVDCKAEGKDVPADVIDHITPLALGGKDVDSNTRPLCHRHHRRRTAEQFGHKQRLRLGRDGWPVD